jgi:tetraacyldisaccharide 4'-kinase
MGSVVDAALSPAESLFASIVSIRNRGYDRGWLPGDRASIPVVSVGNLSVGGVGKTPFTAWTARRLVDLGLAPAIVLRGYGGDEVLVHRHLNPDVPVVVARRRVEAVEQAAGSGRNVAILDDGFQHRALWRDLDVVLVSAESWSDRRRLLPRGPWRESITALRRADVVVVTRKAEPPERALEVAGLLRGEAPDAVLATCFLAPTGLTPLHGAAAAALETDWLRGRAVLAATSLGDPHAFLRQLELMGAEVELMAFPDHHEFERDDAAAVLARAAGRPVVVTRKEAVKIRDVFPPSGAFVLDQRVEMEMGERALLERLHAAVTR